MRTRTALLILLVAFNCNLVTTPAWGLTASEAASIKHLGVVSAMGDTIYVGYVHVFKKEVVKSKLPSRELDAAFTAEIAEQIAASGRIAGDIVRLHTDELDTEVILREARKQGLDAVVVMEPVEDTRFHMTGPGLTLLQAGHMQKAFTCNCMRIRVLRVADGKRIDGAFDDGECPAYFNLPFWHDKWEDYSDAERDAIYAAMREFVKLQIATALKSMQLHAHSH